MRIETFSLTHWLALLACGRRECLNRMKTLQYALYLRTSSTILKAALVNVDVFGLIERNDEVAVVRDPRLKCDVFTAAPYL